MEVYKTKKIPVSRFFYVFNENDYRGLIKEFDIDTPDEDFKYEGKENLHQIFTNIYYSYCEHIEDRNALLFLKRKNEIHLLEAEYSVVVNVLDCFKESEDIIFLTALDELENYKIDFEKQLKPQINNLIRKLKFLKNKINLKKANFSKKYKNKLKESEESGKNKKKVDVFKQAAELEIALDLKYNLDPDDTSLIKWCKLLKLAQIKKEKYEQNQNNLRRSSKKPKRIS